MSEQTQEEELEERMYNKILSKVQDEMKSQIKQIDERVEKMELSKTNNNNGYSTWFCIGSGAAATKAPSRDDDPSIFKLSEDLYSILSTASWKSIPFWISILVIVGFQYSLAILLLWDQFNINSDDNPLNLPANVEANVRISQVLLIVIALFSQRDLLDAIESLATGFPDHFRGNSRFAGMTSFQWKLSAIVQLIQGLLNFSASFVLAVQTETVLDLVLNVLGVAFITELDEVAFHLCTKGYFGGSMKRMSKDVCEVRFHRIVNWRISIPIDAESKVKKDAHIITALAFFFVGLAWFGYLGLKQKNGAFVERHLRIEFGDEVLPFLGLFNGCYRISESNKHIARRLVYEQVGYPNGNGGKFGFCPNFGEGDGGWTFYIGEQNDICNNNNYVLRSGDTSTFSLLEAGKTKWYTYDDLPMDYLEITENKAPTTECGQSMFDSTQDACPSILAFDTMSMTKLSPSVDDDNLDASVTHPIYYSNNNETLVFFTGRRWIRTKSEHIQRLGSEPISVKEIENFFSENGLFKFINQLRTSVDEEAEWVSAVSEIVDTVRDQGSPLGLLWYLPRYEANIDDNMSESVTAKLRRNFPSANLARPIDSVWTCLVCDNDSNPCLHEGDCNTTVGTCVCKHGETGELCQVLPLGNGICNLHYNKEEHNYDGGDCCGGTCRGGNCGQDDLPDPFVSIAPDPTGMVGGWYYPFQNKTEEWKDTFGQREFAYGVNIDSGEKLSMSEMTDFPRRFSHCIDTNTALLTIQQHVTPFQNDNEDWVFVLAGTAFRCDGTLYLQTPLFATIHNLPNYTFMEQVRVPYGARCTIGFLTDEHPIEFSIFAGNQSVPSLQKKINPGKEAFSFRIPESKCVWDAFVEHRIPPVFVDIKYEEFATGVDLDAMCAQDRGEVLDRYAVWKISKSLADGDSLQRFDAHVCDLNLEWTDSMLLLCSDNRRVSFLGVTVNSLPSEIGVLTQLTTLVQTTEYGNLTMSLPTEIGRLTSLEMLAIVQNQLTSVPSELGNLASLTSLSLKENQLTSIPSEVGNLKSLKELNLKNNTLTSIPFELGNLASLTRLDLDYNPMTWDSLPKEVQDLEPEGENIIHVCDINLEKFRCLDFECIDIQWSYGPHSCSTYKSLEYCAMDEFLTSGLVLVDPDEFLNGKNACCICGGGDITFFL